MVSLRELETLTIQYLRTHTPIDTSPDPEEIYDMAKDILEECKEEWTEEEAIRRCYMDNCIYELSEYFYEICGDIVLTDDNKLEVLFPEPEWFGESEDEFYEHAEIPGACAFFPKEIYTAWKEYTHKSGTFLGVYHTHPVTIPCPSRDDIRMSEKYDTVLDMIDNKICGIVAYIGGYPEVSREEIAEPLIDIYISEEPSGEWAGARIVEIPIYSKEDMIRLTKENLRIYSLLSNKIMYWRDPQGRIWKYYKGSRYLVFTP